MEGRAERMNLFALLEKGVELVNLKSFQYYDRMKPTQDALPQGGFAKMYAARLKAYKRIASCVRTSAEKSSRRMLFTISILMQIYFGKILKKQRTVWSYQVPD